MLAVSPLRSTYKDEREEENIDRFSIAGGDHQEEFSCGSLLDSIDFDDIFIGIEDGDVLPDLEIDSSDMLADYSVSNGEDSSDNQLIINVSTLSTASDENNNKENDKRRKKEEEEEEEDGRGERGNCTSGSSTSWNLSSSSVQAGGSDQEIVSKREEVVHDSVAKEESDNNDNNNNNNNNNNKGRKSSGNNLNKGSQGKRKVKVDWTPELHRRFVQVVEQLGMDKAVPSRILELMGIDCLTRHNIASHLQKYRSHQKHLRAREAEAASWNQRRQMYGGGGGKRGDMNPWLAPTMGFPHHPPPPPPPTSLQPFRPLHVWGHPTHVHDHHQPLMHMWPKHLAHHHHHSGPSPPPRLPWMPPPPLAQPPPPPPDPSYWHLHHQRVPNALTPGTPCFPQTLATRFPVAPVPGIPQHGMYKVEQSIGVPTGQSDFQPPFDHFHPSKESIDAAIGDVLSKPWLPLPLGLKPPSLDSVMVELQRQGIPKIPPSAA